MPILAHCTIYCDSFDNKIDAAAIHCGHTFHHLCLMKWLYIAPSQTCPLCRIQAGERGITNKLFFNIAPEEQSELDAKSLQNELDKVKTQLSMKKIRYLKQGQEEAKKETQKLEKKVKSMKRKYESLKESQKASNHKVEKLRKELSYADHKLQKTVKELKRTTEKLKNTKIVLRSADNLIMCFSRVLGNTIKVPSLTSEAISGLSLKD